MRPSTSTFAPADPLGNAEGITGIDGSADAEMVGSAATGLGSSFQSL
jgi:hypothetical protein